MLKGGDCINRQKPKGLTEKQYLFCKSYAKHGDCERAAIAAGYRTSPRKTGNGLLERADIKRKIKDMRLTLSETDVAEMTKDGYRRLAFGEINDAVRLIFEKEPEEEFIKELDLFNVSEIKQDKNGNVELKFFDRLEALERLSAGKGEASDTCAPFYLALKQGVSALRQTADGSRENTERAEQMVGQRLGEQSFEV